MSMQHQEEITCPACQKGREFYRLGQCRHRRKPGNERQHRFPGSLSLSLPALRHDGQYRLRFLYHDADRRFMVFYGPTENDEQRADRDMTENHEVF